MSNNEKRLVFAPLMIPHQFFFLKKMFTKRSKGVSICPARYDICNSSDNANQIHSLMILVQIRPNSDKSF